MPERSAAESYEHRAMTVRRPPRDLRPLDEPADLTAIWRAVLAGEPLRQRVVWMLLLNPARQATGPVITLDDLPDGPYNVPEADLVGLCRDLIDGPGEAASVAFLMSRPGSAPWTVSDRAWGRFLHKAASQLGPPMWTVHWAHQREITEFILR